MYYKTEISSVNWKEAYLVLEISSISSVDSSLMTQTDVFGLAHVHITCTMFLMLFYALLTVDDFGCHDLCLKIYR
jgi:hypothetical protein